MDMEQGEATVLIKSMATVLSKVYLAVLTVRETVY